MVGAARQRDRPVKDSQRTQPLAGLTAATASTVAFRFTYVDNSGVQVLRRKDAAVRLSDTDYTPLYRIYYPADLCEHVFVKSCVEDAHVQKTIRSGSTILQQGWVRESAANEQASGLTSTAPTNQGARVDAEQGASRAIARPDRRTGSTAESTSAHTHVKAPSSATAASARNETAGRGKPTTASTRSGFRATHKRAAISASASSPSSSSATEAGFESEQEPKPDTIRFAGDRRRLGSTSTSRGAAAAEQSLEREGHSLSSNTIRTTSPGLVQLVRKPLHPPLARSTNSSAPCLELLSSSPPVQQQRDDRYHDDESSSPPPLSALLSRPRPRAPLGLKTQSENVQPLRRGDNDAGSDGATLKKRRTLSNREVIELC